MDAFSFYHYATSAWLALQATPLFLTPKLILALLAPDHHHATEPELYLSRLLALALFSLALIALLSCPANPANTPPLTLPLTLFNSLTTLYIYTSYTALTTFTFTPDKTNTAGLLLGLVGYGALSCVGLWCLIFGGGAHLSKRTGADKRTSGFPFRNTSAYSPKIDKKLG